MQRQQRESATAILRIERLRSQRQLLLLLPLDLSMRRSLLSEAVEWRKK
jgi:hypothetical protein